MYTRIFIVAALLLTAAACGKAPEQPVNTNTAPAANANQMSAAPVDPANIPPEFQKAPNGNAAVKPPTANGAEPKTFSLPGKDGPAPDDSDVKTQLADNLVQVRTFHSNPTIAKVEKTTILAGGNARSVTKVYLKNGQVKEIDIQDPLTAPVADIIKAMH
jgi:hypothetical protein